MAKIAARLTSAGPIAGDRFRLFGLRGTQTLGRAMAEALGCQLAAHEEREFEDGEAGVGAPLHAILRVRSANGLTAINRLPAVRRPHRGWRRGRPLLRSVNA
jgi:hypothetical protein